MQLVAAFDSLATRRVVLFGGKGGVGKTTLSTIAALHYAQTRKVILFSTDPASNLETLVTTQRRNLATESLDAKQLYAKFLETNLQSLLEIGDRGTYLDRDELRRFFELSLPGVDELMAWMRIGELAERNEEAIVVVDTAPTGHTVRMLDAAKHFRQFAEALDALEEKHRGMVRQLTRRSVRDAIDDYISRFDDDARRRRELLTSRDTAGFIPVVLSEPWVVDQTIRLVAEVREDGIDVPFVILNRAVLDPDCARDRALQKRDGEARKRVGVTVIDAPRSCVPLDSLEALEAYPSPGLRPPSPRGAGRGKAEGPLRHTAKLLFLAGKGGVGKTTCAASIALQLAKANPAKRYTTISVDPAHALRDVFAAEAPPENLAIEIIDTRAKWTHLRETLGDEIERAVASITPGNFTVAYDGEAMRRLIDIAPPGADELFAVSRLSELAADESQAMVIVDTAPTGHFLRLLELPKTAGDWVREFIRILLRYRQLVPPGSLGEELVSASRAMHTLDEALHSDRSSVIVVTRPDKIVIAETNRLIDELQSRKIGVSAVIANYLTPANDCKCDQSIRAHELESIRGLRPGARGLIVIERRDAPPTALADLAALFRVASD
ncbi:MAG TPA: TRC40/GET3/ArsA family transport-energizing ATPase [Thermoanaerobaculia bacterium]|nr:TRC40/GET3/ArsA family transport-energizing ATPase [Thermoanaerobaculia bacterium]